MGRRKWKCCFRPLAGIMVLILYVRWQMLYRASIVSVPLRGLWFLSCFMGKRIICVDSKVSVPLRGLWFLSVEQFAATHDSMRLFPSPCGDYGSYQTLHDIWKSVWLLFPSPCGDYGSYQPCPIPFHQRHGRVSVPLRGLWFLSSKNGYRDGIYVVTFPSPCGDYGSYQLHIVFRQVLPLPTRFRPLAGIMVLIHETPFIICPIYKKCFRPLAGIMVLIWRPLIKRL